MGDYTDFLRGKIETALRNCKAYKTKSDLQTTMLMAADCIETLQAQLAAAQRRESAAVEDIHTVYSNGLCEVCGRRDTCLMTLDRGEDGTVCHGIKFEWRGPQETGEGERDE